MPNRTLRTTALAVLILFAAVPDARSDVLVGVIHRLPESMVNFTWGDGENDLTQRWTVRNENSAGWFYGLDYTWSNCDVYVYADLNDPTVVTDASVFPYESGAVWATEGSTVFFRGANGYYGAWYVDDIYSPGDPDDPIAAYLDGVWYFVTDQSADFSQGTVAAELQTLSGVKALFD